MKQAQNIALLLLFVSSMISCVSSPDFDDVPAIEFVAWTTDSMNQGDLNTDSVFIKIAFEDGDGDIGYPSSDPTRDVYIFDTRTGDLQEKLKMPEVPEDGTGNGISGEITLRVYNTCCLFPMGIPPCASPPQYPIDSIQYEIYIEDRAGNESNIILTPYLILKCR